MRLLTFDFEIACECGSDNVEFIGHNDVKGVPIFKCNECNTVGNFDRFLYEIK